jgi:uncharacterized protein YggU (UPF0235/DUF167 family)
LLSKALDLPVGNIRIVSGTASPHKTIEILGLDAAAVHEKLSA